MRQDKRWGRKAPDTTENITHAMNEFIERSIKANCPVLVVFRDRKTEKAHANGAISVGDDAIHLAATALSTVLRFVPQRSRESFMMIVKDTARRHVAGWENPALDPKTNGDFDFFLCQRTHEETNVQLDFRVAYDEEDARLWLVNERIALLQSGRAPAEIVEDDVNRSWSFVCNGRRYTIDPCPVAPIATRENEEDEEYTGGGEPFLRVEEGGKAELRPLADGSE